MSLKWWIVALLLWWFWTRTACAQRSMCTSHKMSSFLKKTANIWLHGGIHPEWVTPRCGSCGGLTPFRHTRVPRLQIVRFSFELGSGQRGERPEHTLSFWQSVSSSQIWPAGLKLQSWPQHRPWLGLWWTKEKRKQRKRVRTQDVIYTWDHKYE